MGAPAPGGYMDRARNAAGAANAPLGVAPAAPFPNPGGGYPPAPVAGLPGMPGMMTPGPAPGYPGLAVPGLQPGGYPGAYPGAYPGMNPYGQYGQQQYQQATPTPLPTIKVLVGKRVSCSVCGTLLEDAVQLDVLQSDQDKYLDDGIHDNGIANDGIRGNVETIKDRYIGPECNSVKNRLVNVVRNAEHMSPMEFYRYHIMRLDPITGHPEMPSVLDKEQQRDEALRDWNNKFLADYRIDKNDPKSEFFQLYIPDPPQVPRYPVPPGYVAPQKLRDGTTPGQMQQQVMPGMMPGGYYGDPNAMMSGEMI
jgi:hypothetical protein